jgi:hypothetical protein
MGRSPIQGVLPKLLNVILVSEVKSELEQERGANPWELKRNETFHFVLHVR